MRVSKCMLAGNPPIPDAIAAATAFEESLRLSFRLSFRLFQYSFEAGQELAKQHGKYGNEVAELVSRTKAR